LKPPLLWSDDVKSTVDSTHRFSRTASLELQELSSIEGAGGRRVVLFH
jgi:hypothetical protein